MLFYLIGTILSLFGGFLVVKHIFKIIRSKQILANVNTQIERLKICNQCDHVRLKKTKYIRCTKCGCFLKPKTRLLNQECPVGKWNASNSD